MRSHFRSIRCQGIAAICLLAIMTASQANGEVIGYWPLDGNGTASVGEDGILVNDPSAAPDRNGTAGGALLFEGFDQYVEVPEGGGLDGILGGTISMWVNWSGPQNGDCCGTFVLSSHDKETGSFLTTFWHSMTRTLGLPIWFGASMEVPPHR